jgi:uncharacterized protein (DUF608 family)
MIMRWMIVLVCGLAIASAARGAFDVETGRIVDETWKSGVPLGGIGCGKIEIITDGSFGYYTGNHNWDRPTGVLKGAVAAVYADAGNVKGARLLRLKTNNEYGDVENVAGVEYVGWFPTAEVKYNDAALPVKVEMLGWSPLIPHNSEDSSLPVAVLRFKVANPEKQPARAVIAMAWPNLIGWGGHRGVEWNDLKGNTQTAMEEGQLAGLIYSRQGKTEHPNVDGTYLLAAVKDGCEVRTLPMFDAAAEKLAWWGRFKADGGLDDATSDDGKRLPIVAKQPAGVVAAEVKLAPSEVKTVEFVLVWHFPHHVTAPSSTTGRFIRGAKGGEEAFDGRSDTRWTTGQSMRPGQTFAIEMGQTREITRVVLENKPNKDDYPHGARIDVSEDAKHWAAAAEATKEQIERAKNEGVLDVSFPAKSARHIKIVQQGEADGKWWSIHEVNVYDASGAAIAHGDWTGWPYHEEVVPDMTRAVDVGHLYSNRFKSEKEIANYVVTNQERLLKETQAWQEPVKTSNLPAWLKTKLINSAFTLYACGVLTKDGRFAVLESPVDMNGALGTMDQRMAAHAFYTQMFPELDQSELRLFAACQDKVVIRVGKGASATTKPADGRISHFCGNVHETIGDPNVNYGVTNWPDLSCSFIMQVEKLYKWTGDKKFIDDMYPHVKRALAWLETAAPPGEVIPEGGSTYDYEHIPDAAFIYNASCYLGALRAGAEMAREEGDAGMQSAYQARFDAVQASVMKTLWNGSFFIKEVNPKTGKKNPNSFVAALAGDWLSRLSACGRTLDPKISHAEAKELIARHVKPFYPVMPMEVTPDGKQATQACYVIQHEPYLGCEAIYEGMTDDGLEVIRRVYELAWTQNRNPWHESLMYRSPGGLQQGLVSYMTCPATWHVLNALSGATIDIPAQTLYVSPRVGEGLKELHMPVNFSRAWLWLDYVPAQHVLKIKVTKTFGDAVSIRAIAGEAGAKVVKLETPFVMKEGEQLDLSNRTEELVEKSQ